MKGVEEHVLRKSMSPEAGDMGTWGHSGNIARCPPRPAAWPCLITGTSGSLWASVSSEDTCLRVSTVPISPVSLHLPPMLRTAALIPAPWPWEGYWSLCLTCEMQKAGAI